MQFSSPGEFMRNRLIAKFMLPTIITVAVIMLAVGWVTARLLESEIRDRANTSANSEVSTVLDILSTTNSLSSANVQAGMKVLMREGRQTGVAEVNGTATIAGQSVPDLRLGGKSQIGNFALVDRVKELSGNTATLFVKRGNEFVRVSTNVVKSDGSRAMGRPL